MNIFLYGKKDHTNLKNLRFIMSENTKNNISLINVNGLLKNLLRDKLILLDKSRENN